MLCKIPHIEELVSPERDFEFLQKLANSQWLELLSDGGVLDIPSCRNLVLSLSRDTNTSYDVALVLLIQHALSLKRFDLALPLSRVGNIKHSNPYYTMALIQVALASRNESRAIELALAAIRSPEASNRSSLIHLTQILSHLVNARYFAAAKPIVKKVTSLVCKSPSLPAFDALINYYSELHDTENVEVVWQKLIDSGIRPDVKVHCSRITAHSLSQPNNHANLLKAFDEFLATQMAPNTKIITMVVRSYCKNGQPTHAIALIERAVHQWGLQPTTTAMNNLILVLSTRKRSYKSAFQIFNTMCLSWLRGDQGLGPAAEGSNDWDHVYSVCKESRTSPSDDVREPEQLADTGSGQQRRGFMSWLTSQVHWTPHTSTGTHQLGLPSQVLGLNHNSAATIGGGGRDGGDDNNDRGVSSMKDWNHRTSSLPGVIIPPPSFHTFKIIIPASCRFGELSHVSYIWWMFLLWSKSPNFNSSGISVLKPVVSDPPSPASGPDRFAKLSAQLRALCSAEAAHNTKATLGPMFWHMAGLVDGANFQQQRMLRKQKLVTLSMGILKRLDHEGKLVKRLGDAILKPLLQPSNIDSNAAPGP
ncbi:hypothetical protein EV182_003583 [Spiromyces aspiralis]|uniref:Uncharacterized protein n=1 Tax=Spiromyces aspiralis TaxID=68401 RepID=A0ACC1HGD3_9FUNG|nr:hypothetical protein EV182_003583 [Spiromyces aspiralis]